MKPENEEKQSQRSLEDKFDELFGKLVSEWNPCYTEDGQWRYR